MKKSIKTMQESSNASATNSNDRIVKVNGKNVLLHEGEYIVWTFSDGGDPYKTKREALESRTRNFGHLYASEAEMDRLIPVHREIWTGKFGMESSVPVCFDLNERAIGNGNDKITKIETLCENDCGEFSLYRNEIDHTYYICNNGGFVILDCPSSTEEMDLDTVYAAIDWYLLKNWQYGVMQFNYQNLEENLVELVGTTFEVAIANKRFTSFNIIPILKMLADLNLTLTETRHSGKLYTFKADDDESGVFSTEEFPMSVTVEVSPSLFVTLTVINRKNSRVFIHKRGCNISKGEELQALDALIRDMSCRTHVKIEKLTK